jgi:hypothetical protein
MKNLLEEICYLFRADYPTVDGRIFSEEELKLMVAKNPRLEWDDKYRAVIYRTPKEETDV